MKESQREIKSVWQKTPYANLLRFVPSGTYFARLRVRGKLIRKSLKTDRITVAKLRLSDLDKQERQLAESQSNVTKGKISFADAVSITTRKVWPKRSLFYDDRGGVDLK